MKWLRHIMMVGCILFGMAMNAQRVSTGVTAGLVGYHRTAFDNNYLFPSNSYYIYYIGDDTDEKRPQHVQYANGGYGGVNLNVDYKRWMFTVEVLGGVTNIKTPLYYPNELGGILSNSWSTFETQKASLMFDGLVSYKITQRANGPFLISGLQYATNKFSETRNTLDTDISDGIMLWVSDREMHNIIYTNTDDYWNAIGGVGLKVNDHYGSIRYVQRVGGLPGNYPAARFSEIHAVYAITLNFQKLRKGYRIYLDE